MQIFQKYVVGGWWQSLPLNLKYLADGVAEEVKIVKNRRSDVCIRNAYFTLFCSRKQEY